MRCTFTNTLYDRRRRGPARKPVLRLSWSRRLVTFKAASSGARCYAVTMQYRAAPFETAHVVSPRLLRFAKSISSYLELSRDARLRSPLEIVCSSTLKYRIYVCRYIGRACQRNGWFRLDSALIPPWFRRATSRLHGNYTRNTVLPCVTNQLPPTRWDGFLILKRSWENRRSLDGFFAFSLFSLFKSILCFWFIGSGPFFLSFAT